jgi:NitT/TauT family transport system ATP-binding protein
MAEPTPSPFVVARSLVMRFPSGVAALEGVDVSLARGGFTCLVGPSGCGKSTLLRLVAGLIAPTGGELAVDGMTAEQARRTGHGMAFVFQQPALLPWRTVVGNVRRPLELGGGGGGGGGRVAELLGLVGLEEFAGAYPRQLSGGMRMRVSLAQALATRPGLLLMDEPFGALDEITRQRLNEELLRLWAAERFTALFVTHNVYEAAFLGQRVLVMSRRPGRIAAEVEVPFGYPRSPELRSDGDFARLCGTISRRLEEASA